MSRVRPLGKDVGLRCDGLQESAFLQDLPKHQYGSNEGVSRAKVLLNADRASARGHL